MDGQDKQAALLAAWVHLHDDGDEATVLVVHGGPREPAPQVGTVRDAGVDIEWDKPVRITRRADRE